MFAINVYKKINIIKLIKIKVKSINIPFSNEQ